MGTSTDGILAYGYNLGGGDAEWNIKEVGEYGSIQVPWLSEDDSFTDVAEKRILTSVGFTEDDWQVEGYFARLKEAEGRAGVEFEHYCSDSYSAYVLAAKVITANRGDCLTIDFEALTREATENRWDEKLARAIEALGITPTQERPTWLLCSWWG